MKIAKFWTRGRASANGPYGPVEAEARGWSNESLDDARLCAENVARKVAQRLAMDPSQKNQYAYGDRPLPEPTVRELGPDAIVTRNVYGSLVMNVEHLMFIDVDQAKAMENIRAAAERNGLSARVYSTAAGLRVIIPNIFFASQTPDTESLLREFRADPMYIRLCHMQQSYRARISPKPWRCGFRKPPVKFPYETPSDAAAFRQWEAEYAARSAAYATCRYETTFGGIRIRPEFETLIEYHDVETKANSSLPLA